MLRGCQGRPTSVAVKKPAAVTRMLHSSLVPQVPAPSVAQPLASIWQKVELVESWLWTRAARDKRAVTPATKYSVAFPPKELLLFRKFILCCTAGVKTASLGIRTGKEQGCATEVRTCISGKGPFALEGLPHAHYLQCTRPCPPLPHQKVDTTVLTKCVTLISSTCTRQSPPSPPRACVATRLHAD